MERFAYDLSHALAAKIDLKLVKWGDSGRIAAVLVALPYLTIKATFLLLRGGIDVIQVQDGLLAPTGYLLAKFFRKPFVVVIHGLDITYRNWLFRITVPWAVRQASTVICISQAAANEVRKRGVSEAKIQIIPLAVTDDLHGQSTRSELLQQLELSVKSPLLLTVGRLVKRKGVAWFIGHVLPGLIEQHPELVYLVVGEGPDRPAIEAAVSKSGLAKHVRLLGRVGDNLYKTAYNGADVFVMPNINVPDDMEGFGLVLLEASLCKLPVVAADTEGIQDAVTEGRNGVLVPAKDMAAFQHEIARFLDDPKHAKEFGEASRQFTLGTYQWHKLADRYIEQYQSIIDLRSQSP